MNPISHKLAQDWLQQRLDGQFDARQAATLAEHLHSCAVCRNFAAWIEQIDANLRQEAQARHMAVSQIPLLPDSATSMLQEHMRLKMKKSQVMNFTTSIAFVAAMLALAIGLSWLLSAQNRANLPGIQGDSRPAATATPLPWTKDAPLTDLEQIKSILNTLAQKNVATYQQAGWVHIIRKDKGLADNLPVTYSDGWFEYPQDAQVCVQGMETVTQGINNTPDQQPLQILINRSGGASGDLIQLRSGNEAVTYLKPGDTGCTFSAEDTPAGQLLARLETEQAASAEKIDIQAWYETAPGRIEFVIAVTFTAPSKANAAGILKETQHYEVEKGLLIEASMRMEWPDGKLFGESTQEYLTEFVAVMPAGIAAQWKEHSGELQTYVTGVNALLPTTAPEIGRDPVIVVEDQQFISPTKPLTDGQTILQIQEALERLQIRQLSRPGWYVYGPNSINTEDWMSNRYMLIHTIDESGACDYMSYYLKDGKLLPQEIALADGRWGWISSVENGKVEAGEKGKINWSNGPMSATCQVPNVETLSYLRNETRSFRDLTAGKNKGTYKGWTEQIRGRKFFVLYTELEINGFGTVMDPATRKLEPIARQESWLYFDLNWGTVIEEASVQVFHLQNGGMIGAAPTPEKTVDAGYRYYEKLPADLQTAFDKVTAELAALYP
jgi:hypothetical protein